MVHQPLLSNIPNGQVPTIKCKELQVSMQSELSESIKGMLYSQGDPSFELHSKIFNGDVICQASLLVQPFDAGDVSQIVKFCTRHSLSLSVKAGGYGTHGHAVQGDIIVDISLLNGICIETTDSQGRFTSIKDMPSSKHAGKSRELNDEISPEVSINLHPQGRESLAHLLGKRRADEAFSDNASKVYVSGALPSAVPLASDDMVHFEGVKPPSKLPRSEGYTVSSSSSHPFSPEFIGSAGTPALGVALQHFSRSNSGKEITSNGNPNASHPDNGSLLSDSTKSSVSTRAISIDSRTSKSPSTRSLQPDIFNYTSVTTAMFSDLRTCNPPAPAPQSDPFGYMSDPPAGLSTTASLSTFEADPPGVVSQPLLQQGLPLFSSAGHYMPTRVNPIFPHAFVTFGAGARQKDIDTYSSSHPLAATSLEGTPCFTPYHVPFSAHPVGSSNMLLGGFGFLSRLHGLSIDNLVEVEMVLADGNIVVVNENEHPDLWWAMRGAGTAFGIATRYKAKAYPVPVVFAGNLLYKFRRSTAASLIKHFRDCVKNVPRELYANIILTAGPDGDALLVIQICYLGPQDRGVEFLQAITSWDGEQCLLNEVSEKSFLNQQDSLAQLLKGKPGRKWFIRSNLLSSLSDEMIHETVLRFADTPVGCTWLFELSGGNVSDEHGGCFPASVRQATWTIAAFHQWELYEDDPRCVTSAEEWINETLGPASTGGPFPSFFGIHESGARIKGSFGDSWQRLCEIKHRYDPEGFFTHNFWPLDKNDQPKTTLVPTRTEF